MEVIKTGLNFAMDDYLRIGQMGGFDVKPKEDQIKCGLYRSFTEAGFLVHVEAAYARGGARCDLIAYLDEDATAIEIKTAWAGDNWRNKPVEQAHSWEKDVKKLEEIRRNNRVNNCFFVLFFAYQAETYAELRLREKINYTLGVPEYASNILKILSWNDLDSIQYFIFKL